MIRTLIVEDHFLARIALRSVLEQTADVRVVGEADNAAGAIAAYRKHRPDIVIMDLRLTGSSGIEAIVAIVAEFPHARILVLTNFTGSEDIYRAVQAGARGYLTKDAGADGLIEAIRTVHRGLRYFPAEIGGRLAERMAEGEMTPRERQVLELLARGLTNQAIADELGIAEKTVRIHVSSILGKMGVTDRTKAVVVALQRGIVHLD